MIPDQEIPVKILQRDLRNKIFVESGVSKADFEDLYFKITFDPEKKQYFCCLRSSTSEYSHFLTKKTTKELMSFLRK
jgi:hypothetical protein